jgi:hypothetical protein
MTAPALSSAMCVKALNALALVDAYNTRDLERVAVITLDTEPADLVSGLLLLASGFRAGQAAAMGCTEADLTEQARAMYLLESAGLSGGVV